MHDKCLQASQYNNFGVGPPIANEALRKEEILSEKKALSGEKPKLRAVSSIPTSLSTAGPTNIVVSSMQSGGNSSFHLLGLCSASFIFSQASCGNRTTLSRHDLRAPHSCDRRGKRRTSGKQKPNAIWNLPKAWKDSKARKSLDLARGKFPSGKSNLWSVPSGKGPVNWKICGLLPGVMITSSTEIYGNRYKEHRWKVKSRLKSVNLFKYIIAPTQFLRAVLYVCARQDSALKALLKISTSGQAERRGEGLPRTAQAIWSLPGGSGWVGKARYLR